MALCMEIAERLGAGVGKKRACWLWQRPARSPCPVWHGFLRAGEPPCDLDGAPAVQAKNQPDTPGCMGRGAVRAAQRHRPMTPPHHGQACVLTRFVCGGCLCIVSQEVVAGPLQRPRCRSLLQRFSGCCSGRFRPCSAPNPRQVVAAHVHGPRAAGGCTVRRSRGFFRCGRSWVRFILGHGVGQIAFFFSTSGRAKERGAVDYFERG